MSQDNQSFIDARKHFEEMINWLKSSQPRGLNHSEIEEKLKVNGNEILRRLWQGYLDERAEEEIIGECIDEVRERKEDKDRRLINYQCR